MEAGKEIIKEWLIEDIQELDRVAEEFLNLQRFPLVLLRGDLGAGKTSFVRRLMHILGSTDQVTSPSYSIANEYHLDNGNHVYHLDLYRIESPGEAFNIGLEEYLYSGFLCMVEWPQIILDYIEEPYHRVDIEILDGDRRKIILS